MTSGKQKGRRPSAVGRRDTWEPGEPAAYAIEIEPTHLQAGKVVERILELARDRQLI